MLRAILLIFMCISFVWAKGPVYVVLWFDTEDYVDPAADDAALRIARDLSGLGVRATFKVVGEKARVLETRKRYDVIRALSEHDIGFHSRYHSIQPTPAVYLRDENWLSGAAEFTRREGPGVRDLHRIFGVIPSCYGQPGSSWAPQAFPALRRLGIPVYLDEADTIGLDGQPFWFGGLLNVFHMEPALIRPSLEDESRLPETLAKFDRVAADLAGRGGGLISSYFHPTEFVNRDFWDAVNFPKGASREREDWQPPHPRTKEEAERAFRILHALVEHAKGVPAVQFVTARELPLLYQSPTARAVDRTAAAAHLLRAQTFLVTGDASYSAADLLLALLGLDPQYVDGPAERRSSTWQKPQIPRPAFERAKADAVDFIRTNHRLPSQVWIGSEFLALPDFAATLAGDTGAGPVALRKGNPEMERYVSRNPVKAFSWAIHPEGFNGANLLDLARLQTWTLKPARLK